MPKANNLITDKTIQRFRTRALKRNWRRAVVTLGMVAIFLTTWFRNSAANQSEELIQDIARSSQPRQVAVRNERLTHMLEQAKIRAQQQASLRSNYSPLSAFALLSEIKHTLDGDLLVEVVDFSLSQPSNAQKANSPARGGRLQLQVVTSSTSNSSKVIELLRQSRFFQDVQLNTALSKVNPSGSDLRFSVVCEF